MHQLVDYQLQDGIATLTMDDGKANVMNVAMLAAIAGALDQAEADGAVVLLCGRPGLFSGGFDLAVFKSDLAETQRMLVAGARLAERLLGFPRPVVVACTGHAIAMGAFVLLSADLRVGVDSGARLQLNEVQIGLTLPHFAIECCRQRLSPAHQVQAALNARSYDPQSALAAGFLDEVASVSALAGVARSRAEQLRGLNAAAFTATKARMRRPVLEAMRQAIDNDIQDWSARFLDRS